MPANFKVVFRYSGAEETSTSSSVTTVQTSVQAAREEVSLLRRCIDRMGKKAAGERRAAAAAMQELKDCAKKRSRELWDSIAISKSKIADMNRSTKRLTSDAKYYSKKVWELSTELTSAKQDLFLLRASEDSAIK